MVELFIIGMVCFKFKDFEFEFVHFIKAFEDSGWISVDFKLVFEHFKIINFSLPFKDFKEVSIDFSFRNFNFVFKH